MSNNNGHKMAGKVAVVTDSSPGVVLVGHGERK